MPKMNYDGQTYKQWEDACDNAMTKKFGVGIDDIPDMLWHDWWADDVQVQEAVELAINKVNEEGF